MPDENPVTLTFADHGDALALCDLLAQYLDPRTAEQEIRDFVAGIIADVHRQTSTAPCALMSASIH